MLAGCTRPPASAAPDLPEGAPPPPAAELSRFSAPLSYDFTAVLKVVDRAVPMKFGSLDSVKTVPNDDRRHYAFEAEREPFVAYAEGDLLHLRATLAYAARGYYKPPLAPTMSGGCGGKREERPRILLELATPLTLTSDWHLKSKAALVTVEPASKEQRDRCDVTFLHHDVTDRVLDAARSGITSQLANIDQRVANVDLRERFNGLWKLLARPIRLADNVWLVLNPSRLAIGRVSGRGHVLTIPVTLEARPEIVTATEEPVIDAGALPPLGRDSAASGFHISIDGDIDYEVASAAVARALVGRSVTQSGRSVTVTNATLSPGAKGKLVLAVAFNGDAKGALRFVGTPTYDSVRREIAMPDLDYDLATNNPLINTYAWLRSDAMRTMFRDKAHLPVDDALDRARSLLTAGLNRKIGDAMTLNASVRSVAVRGLFVTRGGIVVRGDATGKAGVAVRQR